MKKWLGVLALLVIVMGLFLPSYLEAVPPSEWTYIARNRIVNYGSTVFDTLAIASNATRLNLSGTQGGYGTFYMVTGTAKTDSISPPAYEGQYIILHHASTDTLLDSGGNLVLAGQFNGTANDITVLIGRGSTWYEVSRSAN